MRGDNRCASNEEIVLCQIRNRAGLAVYRDIEVYRFHLESEHFKRHKATTEKMVKSLKLIRTDVIVLGDKAK